MYLNYPPPLDDIIFTKADLGLLLSNAGAPKINDYVTEQFVIMTELRYLPHF